MASKQPSAQSERQLPPETFSKILVGVDGSEQSLFAAKYALVLAKKDDAELIALMVATLPPDYLGHKILEDWRHHTRELAQEVFNTVKRYSSDSSKQDGRQVRLKTELIESSVSADEAIVNYADKENVDLIVVGTKGMSGLKKLLLGSVASSVISYATKPVLVVK